MALHLSKSFRDASGANMSRLALVIHRLSELDHNVRVATAIMALQANPRRVPNDVGNLFSASNFRIHGV
jgi:hypothetical protein